MIRFGEPEHHKQQSFAERVIQAIQELLLKRMIAQELKTGETSVEWSEDFHDIMYTDIATFLDVFPKWVENWLNAPIEKTGHTINVPDIFQIHEIAYNIIYHLDQLTEEDYWKALVDYKNSDKELERAIKKYLGRNRVLTNPLYKKFFDLADKKEKAFAYQVEIEKIILQSGFAYKKDGEKDHIIYNIQMLANGLDPYKIPAWFEDADSIDWQPDYWGDEDPDDPANWQSGTPDEDPSNSDEDLNDSDEDQTNLSRII
ncbi:hypothetical protein RclHR1_22700002 [Rhizophagus clarus]|uniref:Uncharacterized protein n=1 Tax=Rhizophagus clarus TaxID=94130 RepID=A0A2Z6QUJ8_9GLOM|nr:hypothetical protein RclHR1_22700002 [Rhizophagus clarus]